VCILTAEPPVEPPNDVDKETAISKLKNGKVTGHNKNPAELKKKKGSKRAQENHL
jgi:hypothetical protein